MTPGDPVPPPGDSEGPHRPYEGQLTITRDGQWVDARGPIGPMLGCHWGEAWSAVRHNKSAGGLTVQQQARNVYAGGFPLALVWGALGYEGGWSGREVGPAHQGIPDWTDLAVSTLRSFKAIGLQTFYSTGDILACGGADAYIDALARVLITVGQGVVACVELNNEDWHNGEFGSRLTELCKRLKRQVPWIPVCLSAPPGEPDLATIQLYQNGADFGVQHSWRGGDLSMMLRRLWNEQYEAGTYHETGRVSPDVNKEGPGPQPPGNPKHPYRSGPYVTAMNDALAYNKPGRITMLAGTSAAAGMGYIYFSGYGAYWDGALESQDGFYEAPALWRHMPLTIHRANSKLVHGGANSVSRVFGVPARDDTRADHLIGQDGNFLATLHGPRWKDDRPVRSFDEVYRAKTDDGHIVIGKL